MKIVSDAGLKDSHSAAGYQLTMDGFIPATVTR